MGLTVARLHKELGKLIEQDLQAADVAVMSGDVVAMLQSLETLRGIRE